MEPALNVTFYGILYVFGGVGLFASVMLIGKPPAPYIFGGALTFILAGRHFHLLRDVREELR